MLSSKQHVLCWIGILFASVLSTSEKTKPTVISLEPHNSSQWHQFEHSPQILTSKVQKYKSDIQIDYLTVPLTEIKDFEGGSYFKGAIVIGGQELSVIFSTGSSAFWVRGPRYLRHHYDPKNSKESSKLHNEGNFVTIRYPDGGGAFGLMSSDHVSIGNSPSVENVHFVLARDSWRSADIRRVNGIMGMPALDYWNPSFDNGVELVETFFSQLSKKFDFHSFAFFFGRSGQGSELTIGGYNQDIARRYGKTNFVALTKKSKNEEWIIDLEKVVVNGNLVVENKKAIIDTGAPFIIAPMEDNIKFHEAFGRAWGAYRKPDSKKRLYKFPCGNVPSVSFTFNRVSYHMSTDDMIAKRHRFYSINDPMPAYYERRPHIKYCTSAISSRHNVQDRFWEIGTAFLKNVYTLFEVTAQRIGFISIPFEPFPSSSSSSSGHVSS